MKYGQLKNRLDQIENMSRIEKEIEKLYKLKDNIENFDDKTNSVLKLNEMKIEFEELFMKAYNKALHKKKTTDFSRLKNIGRNLQDPLIND